MLKQQVIQWILNKERDYHAGLYLLKQIHPTDPLLQRPETEYTTRELFTKLGAALKKGISEKTYTEVLEGYTKAPVSDKPITDNQSPVTNSRSPISYTPITNLPAGALAKEGHQSPITETPEKLPGLSPAGRLSLEIDDLKKQRAYHQRKLRDGRTDKQRREHIQAGDLLTHEIVYKRKLIQQLDKGEITELPEDPAVIKQKQQDDLFEVPESLYELDKKLQRLRALRSKRKAKISKLEAANEQGSPDHQQAIADFDLYDKAIRHLDEHKKVRTQGGTASSDK